MIIYSGLDLGRISVLQHLHLPFSIGTFVPPTLQLPLVYSHLLPSISVSTCHYPNNISIYQFPFPLDPDRLRAFL
jgi:hypothetical protein